MRAQPKNHNVGELELVGFEQTPEVAGQAKV